MNPKLLLGLALVLGSLNGVSRTQTDTHLTSQMVAKKSLSAYAALSNYSDTGTTVKSETGGQTTVTTFSLHLQRPNLFRMLWTQTGETFTNQGRWWSDGNTNMFSADITYLLTAAAGQEMHDEPEIIWLPFAMRDARLKSWEATVIPDILLKWNTSNLLTQIIAMPTNTGLAEGKIGKVDCHVISLTYNPAGRTSVQTEKIVFKLWLGKQDYLLHQFQLISDRPQSPTAESGQMVLTQTYENISVNQKNSSADFEQKRVEPHSFISIHSEPLAAANRPKLKNILMRAPTNSVSADSFIVLVSAKFGLGNTFADVTARVGELLRPAPERFIINAQNLGIDPLPGKKKRLFIRYEYKGTTNVVSMAAGYLISREALSFDADNHK